MGPCPSCRLAATVARDERRWTVVDDLDGSPRAITNAELDVIETYLGSLLDELFAECHGTA